MVAAFGDPGLAGLKELFDVPVVGMTEAALASACLLGQRFSIIAISHRIQAWYRECVAANGLSSRLASVRSLQEPLRDIGSVQEDHAARLEQLALQAIEQDGADVIIVAGAPLAGLARSLQGRIPVPVVDGVSSIANRWWPCAPAAPRRAASRGRRASPMPACRRRWQSCSTERNRAQTEPCANLQCASARTRIAA